MAAVSADEDFSPAVGRWKDWFNTVKVPAMQISRNHDYPQSNSVLMPQQQAGPRQQYPQFNSLPNGASPAGPSTAPTGLPTPGARPLEPNQGRVVQAGGARVLCVADVRGDLESLNTLAKEARADYVIHTGDFGFYDERSLERIADKTLKHVVQYSPLIEETTRRQIQQLPGSTSIKNTVPHQHLQLSQLPQFLTGQRKFNVPIYAVWGACEDVQVLEKLRAQEYKIENLHILDEAHSRLLDVGGVKLRLLGLGGAVVMHKLFDNGEGRTTIAGGQGTMWTTLLQIGELIDTANRTFDPTETRLLVTHASPAREGLLNQLAVALKADFSVSGGLHFRYGSSYNEFSVNPSMDHFRGKLAASKASFQDVWDTVRSEVEPIVAENEAHQKLLSNALDVVMKMPAVANGGNPFGGQASGSAGQIDEAAFKNMWNFNLADAAFGYLVLEVEGGRIGTEMRALGFNFSHRGSKTGQQTQEAARATATSSVAPNPSLAPPPHQPNAQPVVSTPSASTAPQSSIQTRPGQQPRATSQQQPSQNRNSQPPSSAPAAPPAQSQPPKAPTPSTRPTSQQPANQAVKQSAPTAPTTNGTPAASDTKPNGVASPAPADAATTSTPPPAPREPSTGIFLTNGPKTEDAVKELFTDSDIRGKIIGVEPQGRRENNGWHIKFNTNDEMRKALTTLPLDVTARDYPQGAMHAKPFVNHTNRGGFAGRGPSVGGYKSGSDTEGGRGGRGGFGRGRGGRGSDRGARGGRGRGGSDRGGQPGQSTASPAPAAASGGGSGDKAS